MVGLVRVFFYIFDRVLHCTVLELLLHFGYIETEDLCILSVYYRFGGHSIKSPTLYRALCSAWYLSTEVHSIKKRTL